MKARKASIYRDMELAQLSLIKISQRVPGKSGLHYVSKRMINEMLDAMTAASMALMSSSDKDKAELLELVSLHLQTVDTCVRVLYEWSSVFGQTDRLGKHDLPGTDPELAKPKIRIVSKRQFSSYLLSMNKIWSQLSRWHKAAINAALSNS